MAIDMTLIEKIDEQKRYRRQMSHYASTLLSIGYVNPNGRNIASVLYPSHPCSNQEAVAKWVSSELKKMGNPKFDLNTMRIRLQNHLEDSREGFLSS